MSAANLPIKSLLVVRLGAMGDIIHTLPAVSALRNAFPVMRLGWIVEERWAELLCARNTLRSGPRSVSRPLVDVLHTVDTKHWRKSLLALETWRQISAVLREVRSENYDIAVDFQGALKSAAIARCAGAGAIFGMEHPRETPARIFYKHRVATKGAHVIEQYDSIAEAVVGKRLPKTEVEFPRNEEAEARIEEKLKCLGKDFVLITPGAGWAAKQWPAGRYGEVAAALSQDGLATLVNFGPDEEPLALAVQSASRGVAQPSSCSIGELIPLTRRARLFIGGDTGPLHLATALRTPVVAIFGPTDPARNGPYGTRNVVLRNPASQTSLSHVNTPDPGLLAITPEEVISAARRLLGSPDA